MAFIALTARFDIPGGYRIFSVLTGSMEPAIPTRAVIITKIPRHENDIAENQIITFIEPGYQNKFITHRIVGVKEVGSGRLFVTKGDANSTPDPWEVPYGVVKGIHQFHIPYVGWLLEFLRSKVGIVIFVVIPVLVLAWKEIRTLFTLVVEKKVNDLHNKKHLFILLALLTGLILATSHPSYALLTSSETSLMNIFIRTAP